MCVGYGCGGGGAIGGVGGVQLWGANWGGGYSCGGPIGGGYSYGGPIVGGTVMVGGGGQMWGGMATYWPINDGI